MNISVGGHTGSFVNYEHAVTDSAANVYECGLMTNIQHDGRIDQIQNTQGIMNGCAVIIGLFRGGETGLFVELDHVQDQLAEELEDKIPVGKIDVDECREIAMEYGVMSIPTVIYFKNSVFSIPRTKLSKPENVLAFGRGNGISFI